MIKALLSSSQAMSMQSQRHDLIANNLANVNTPGFQKLIAQVRSGADPANSSAAAQDMQRLTITSWPSSATGPLKATGNPLDIGLTGEGYFVVETPQGQRLTRDGSLGLSPAGELLHSSGNPILADGSTLTIREAPSILPDGTVMDGDRVVGRLSVVKPNKGSNLRREGQNLLEATGGFEEVPAESVSIAAGNIEGSNVDAIEEMVTMIKAFRAYEIAQKAVHAADETLQIATQKVGAVRA